LTPTQAVTNGTWRANEPTPIIKYPHLQHFPNGEVGDALAEMGPDTKKWILGGVDQLDGLFLELRRMEPALLIFDPFRAT
jgi:hypothetical protein